MSFEKDKKHKRDEQDAASSLAMKSSGAAPEPTMADMKAMLDENRVWMLRMQSEINCIKILECPSNHNDVLS